MKRSVVRSVACLFAMISLAFGTEVEHPAFDALVREVFPADAKGGMAVLVVNDGSVFHAKGYGTVSGKAPVTSDTPMPMASVSKQFAGACAALLVEIGKLKMDEPVSTYLPDIVLRGPDGGRELRIQDLVWHTSGLPNFIEAKEKASIAAFKQERGLERLTNKTHAEWLTTVPLWRQPGTTFEYTNSGYVLLARVIEVVTGMPFHAFQQKHLLDPLRLKSATDSKHFNGSGNMRISLNDYAKWDRALWNAYRMKEHLFQPGMLDDKTPVEYGYGWFLAQDEEGVREVHHGGAGNPPGSARNMIVRDLRERITVAIFVRENTSFTKAVRLAFANKLLARAREITPTEQTTFRLRNTILPKITFKDGRLDNAVNFFVDFSCELTGAGVFVLRVPPKGYFNALEAEWLRLGKRKLGPEFDLELGPEPDEGDGFMHVPRDPAWDKAKAAVDERFKLEPKINIARTNITLGAALELVRSFTPYEQTIEPNGVIVWHEKDFEFREIQRADSDAARKADASMNTLFPEMNFLEAAPDDVVDFLTNTRGTNDLNAEEQFEFLGPNVLLCAESRFKMNVVSFSLRRVTRREAYRYLSFVTGTQCAIQPDGTLVFSTKPVALKPLDLHDPKKQFKDFTVPRLDFRHAQLKDILTFISETAVDQQQDFPRLRAVPKIDVKLDDIQVSISLRSIPVSNLLMYLQNLHDVRFEVIDKP